jgi:hypothetical protein
MFLDVYQRRHSYFNVDFLPALHMPYERPRPAVMYLQFRPRWIGVSFRQSSWTSFIVCLFLYDIQSSIKIRFQWTDDTHAGDQCLVL